MDQVVPSTNTNTNITDTKTELQQKFMIWLL